MNHFGIDHSTKVRIPSVSESGDEKQTKKVPLLALNSLITNPVFMSFSWNFRQLPNYRPFDPSVQSSSPGFGRNTAIISTYFTLVQPYFDNCRSQGTNQVNKLLPNWKNLQFTWLKSIWLMTRARFFYVLGLYYYGVHLKAHFIIDFR